MARRLGAPLVHTLRRRLAWLSPPNCWPAGRASGRISPALGQDSRRGPRALGPPRPEREPPGGRRWNRDDQGDGNWGRMPSAHRGQWPRGTRCAAGRPRHPYGMWPVRANRVSAPRGAPAAFQENCFGQKKKIGDFSNLIFLFAWPTYGADASLQRTRRSDGRLLERSGGSRP